MKPQQQFTKASAAWRWLAEQYENKTEFVRRPVFRREARGVCIVLQRVREDLIDDSLFRTMRDEWETLFHPDDATGYWWYLRNYKSRAFACGIMAAIAESEEGN